MKPQYILISLLVAFSFATVSAQEDFSTDELPVPYYAKKGKFSIHLSEHFFMRVQAVSPPLSIQPELTIARNLTAGPLFMWYQFKRTESQGSSTSVFPEDKVKYHNLTTGIKASLHLNDFLRSAFHFKLKEEYTDFYISGWGGYNFVKSTSSAPDAEFIKNNQAFRGGASIGIRSMVGRHVALFLEAGYSSYTYSAVGFSYIFK